MKSQAALVQEIIAQVRRYYGEGCFACGQDNPHGLRMDRFRFEDGRATAQFDPPG